MKSMIPEYVTVGQWYLALRRKNSRTGTWEACQVKEVNDTYYKVYWLDGWSGAVLKTTSRLGKTKGPDGTKYALVSECSLAPINKTWYNRRVKMLQEAKQQVEKTEEHLDFLANYYLVK
jgi:hypothetical protein